MSVHHTFIFGVDYAHVRSDGLMDILNTKASLCSFYTQNLNTINGQYHQYHQHGPIVIQKGNVNLRQRHSFQLISSAVASVNVTKSRSCWPAYTQRNQNVVMNYDTS